MIGNLTKVFCPTRGVDVDCLKADPWPVYLHFTLTIAFVFALAKHNAFGFLETTRALFGRQKYERSLLINTLQAAHIIPFIFAVWIITNC